MITLFMLVYTLYELNMHAYLFTYILSTQSMIANVSQNYDEVDPQFARVARYVKLSESYIHVNRCYQYCKHTTNS